MDKQSTLSLEENTDSEGDEGEESDIDGEGDEGEESDMGGRTDFSARHPSIDEFYLGEPTDFQTRVSMSC